jgi:hypothetical protein
VQGVGAFRGGGGFVGTAESLEGGGFDAEDVFGLGEGQRAVCVVEREREVRLSEIEVGEVSVREGDLGLRRRDDLDAPEDGSNILAEE